MDTAVYEIQTYIRNISRVDPQISSLVPDGIYGKETADSVTAFQRRHLLPQTGKVDFTTWKRLLEENDKAVFVFSEPLQTAPVRSEDLPLKKDKDSPFNSNINLMLLRLSDFYDNFSSIPFSADYTEETAEQIRLFQSLADIPVTGETDKKTWNLLSSLYLLLSEDKAR